MRRRYESSLRLSSQETAIVNAIKAGGETGVTFASLLRDVAAALGREVKPKSVRRAIYAVDEKLRTCDGVRCQLESVVRRNPDRASKNIVHYRLVGEAPTA